MSGSLPCSAGKMTADDPGYGFVSKDVPELGIAVVPA
jgi:hypothetical protein